MTINNPTQLLRKKIFIYLISFTVALTSISLLTSCTSNAGSIEEDKTVAEGNNATQNNTVESPVVVEKATDLSEKDFNSTIKKGVVLVDFWAPWCAPCRIQGPLVDELAKEMGSKAKITKLNVDNNSNVSNEYSVRNIPTIIIFKDGKEVFRFVGVQDKAFLKQQIEQLL